MSYRLYVDEVGNDDVTHVDEDNHRYLSLTGVAIKVAHARDYLEPEFNSIKATIFNQDPDQPVVFHRTDIVQKKGRFIVLNDAEKRSSFDARIMNVIKNCEYQVITAFVDKKAMLKQTEWRNQHPYHYLMEILVEKYAQFLKRKNTYGDIMPEARKGKKDIHLQEAFSSVRRLGTYYVPASLMQKSIPSSNLKFRTKLDNIAGLQLCDLIAHPSHMHIRNIQNHPVTIGSFCEKVRQELLNSKYDRSGANKIIGYGIKWFP